MRFLNSLNKSMSFLVLLLFVLSYSQSDNCNETGIVAIGENVTNKKQSLSVNLIQKKYIESKCTGVSGINNGIKFKAEFIMDSVTYLHMVFTNISKKTIVLFEPIIHGNQGIEHLAFVEILIPDTARYRIKNDRSVWRYRPLRTEKLVPNDSISYKYKIGRCNNVSNVHIPFKLKYKLTRAAFEEIKLSLNDYKTPGDISKHWFGEIMTDSSFICCDDLTVTNYLNISYVKIE